MAQDAFDVLIIGSGLAGLSAALRLAPTHRVAVLTKRALSDGASGWAQGGIAAVLADDDSFSNHVNDTLTAGAGLCDADATQFVVERAPEAIQWLQALGVNFSSHEGHLHLTREGGHSHRRIVHAADATGAAVQKVLVEHIRKTPNVTLFEHHMLVDLITTHKLGTDLDQPNRCVGAYALDTEADQVRVFAAGSVILATGGAGKVYLYTTNPDTATGDGIAAAWRAGARVANMEFIQFHPTCLYHPHAKSFLISEAVRGEGGQLRLPDRVGGHRFMPDHDERAELAPRDIVARAIDFEMKRHGVDCVYLDISHQPEAFLEAHFPTIKARCLEFGIDITKDPIPVVPAAHYTCGGVAWSSASTSQKIRSRWYPLRTTPAAGSSQTCMVEPTSVVSTPLARPATAVCMVPTVWPATACWSAWFTPRLLRPISAAHTTPSPRCCLLGMTAVWWMQMRPW